MKKIIRKILVGDSAISEYSTITIPGEIREKVYLETDGAITDISQEHYLLCIEPVVFGVWIANEQYTMPSGKTSAYRMYFSDTAADKPVQKNAVAVIQLSYVDHIEEKNGVFLLLKLTSSTIHHIHLMKAYLLFSRYYQKNGLTFSKFKAFVAAYSYPRRIRIISFRSGDYYNIFPMDLLGEIGQCNRYVFGLRHTNITLARIVETGKLIVSEVAYEHKQVIYQLGKHHSTQVPALDNLPFKVKDSAHFGFPVPVWAESYKEIKVLQTINLGSHLLIWGEPVAENQLTEPGDHLFLIHFLHYLHQKDKGINLQLV